jgi:hypothetical protein
MKPDAIRGPATPPDAPPGEGTRSVVSLLIFVHLFLVAICFSGNVAANRSPLQSRLIYFSQAYVQPLNLNPDDTAYHLTHGRLEDVDHRLEVLPEGADGSDPRAWIVLPDVGRRSSERYKRYQRLAKTMASSGDFEEQAGAIARDVGQHFVRAEGITPTELRARRHLLQHWRVVSEGLPALRDPFAETYFQAPYHADLVVTEDGAVFPNKKSGTGETAHVGTSGSSQP